jgi:hypothetical protein
VIGAEPDQIGGVAVGGARKLADVELAARTHLRRRGIADMGVVLPHDRLGVGTAEREQHLQRLEHVLIAQIP